MKIIRFALILALLSFISFGQTQAQEKVKNQIYSVHEDFIKPSMVSEYEKLAVEFNDLVKKYKLDIQYLAVTTDDFTYSYVTPIDNMADLDKSMLAGIPDQAGKDKAYDIFDRMDKCYDVHGDHILILDNELSYMPEGMSQTQEGMDYRTYYRYYYTPENYNKLVESAKAIKAFYEGKNSKRYYRAYRSGFGVSDAYILVAVSAKDAEHNAKKYKEDMAVLGSERKKYISDIMKYTSKFEIKNGWIRRDLSYFPSK
jgi:hypothetical protein